MKLSSAIRRVLSAVTGQSHPVAHVDREQRRAQRRARQQRDVADLIDQIKRDEQDAARLEARRRSATAIKAACDRYGVWYPPSHRSEQL